MKAYKVRRWVHRISGSAALVLLITGTLVSLPDLRTALIGGQGQLLSDIHLWLGLVFVSTPIIALFYSKGSIIENIKKRIFASKKIHWRRIHLSLVMCATVLLGLTGPIMWIDSIWEYPVVVMDAIFLVHLSLAWVVGLVLPAHLYMARKGIARVLRNWFGLDNKNARAKTSSLQDNAIASLESGIA